MRFSCGLIATIVALTSFRACAERLDYPAPEGLVKAWEGMAQNTKIYKYVPPGETARVWTQMVEVGTAHHEHNAQVDSSLEYVKKQHLEECPGGTAVINANLKAQPAHGDATLICPSGANRLPFYTLTRIIRGPENFYSVDIRFKQEPASEQIAAAKSYLHQLRVIE